MYTFKPATPGRLNKTPCLGLKGSGSIVRTWDSQAQKVHTELECNSSKSQKKENGKCAGLSKQTNKKKLAATSSHYTSNDQGELGKQDDHQRAGENLITNSIQKCRAMGWWLWVSFFCSLIICNECIPDYCTRRTTLTHPTTVMGRAIHCCLVAHLLYHWSFPEGTETRKTWFLSSGSSHFF